MPRKEKKNEKKAQKENKDQLSAVDKTFFELTINDLNNKLSNLRTHNAKVEERNAELETQMLQLEEDRADITAYLNRTLNTQANNIKDFEEKLSELAKVRAEETESFQNKIKNWETKYDAKNEELTSEIKLLTGKLNSLEEFRIQKDELMAKFDQQETNLKEQEQRHKDTLYELERKQILEKVRLKNELENRLLQLSNEFVKSNEIRIAAHVQRMTRENIALNNELDRLLFTIERLKKENERFLTQSTAKRQYIDSLLEENAHLVNTSQKQLQIIARLTSECERLTDQVKSFGDSDRLRQMAEVRETVARKELNESKSKLLSLQATTFDQQNECKSHMVNIGKYEQEMNRLMDTLRQLRQKVSNAIQCDDSKTSTLVDDPYSFQMQRQHLLVELQNILMNLKEIEKISAKDSHELDEIPPLEHELYRKGKIGIVPRQSTQRLIKYSHSTYKGRKKSFIDINSQQTTEMGKRQPSLVGCAIIDVDEGGARLQSTDSLRLDDDDGVSKVKTDDRPDASQMRKPSMAQMDSISSSNGDDNSETKQSSD